jgi:hypothetical protein
MSQKGTLFVLDQPQKNHSSSFVRLVSFTALADLSGLPRCFRNHRGLHHTYRCHGLSSVLQIGRWHFRQCDCNEKQGVHLIAYETLCLSGV